MSILSVLIDPLRFDPSLVIFCKHLLQSACLSKAYLRAGVLALTQDILSHALLACRPWEGAIPHSIDQVFVGKNRHHETWIYFSAANLASAFAARG
jgi:hypothetical protein